MFISIHAMFIHYHVTLSYTIKSNKYTSSTVYNLFILLKVVPVMIYGSLHISILW
jgi:hypothetical protein